MLIVFGLSTGEPLDYLARVLSLILWSYCCLPGQFSLCFSKAYNYLILLTFPFPRVQHIDSGENCRGF